MTALDRKNLFMIALILLSRAFSARVHQHDADAMSRDVIGDACVFVEPISQNTISFSGIRALFGVYWAAPFLSGGGYCSEATTFAQVLRDLGVDVAIAQHGDSFNSEYMEGLSAQNTSFLKSMYTDDFYAWFGLRRDISDALAVVVCHSEPGAWDAPQAKYYTSPCPPQPYKPNGAEVRLFRVGRTMFETDRLPSGWAQRLRFMDEVWVPTHFMRDILLNEGLEPSKVRVVPEPVDTEFFRPGPPRAGSVTRVDPGGGGARTTRFLFVGKWEERKGLKILLRSFLKEFSIFNGIPTAHLTILTSAYHSTDKFWSEIEKFVGLENLCDLGVLRQVVSIISNVPSDEMPSLYRSVQALVVPSRGEGWGRPHAEAMACGTPVVATNWSGPTAFIDETVGYPIAVDGLVPAESWKGHRWAEPSETSLRELLRSIVTNPEEAAARGRQARLRMVQLYSVSALGLVLASELCRILLLTHPGLPQEHPMRRACEAEDGESPAVSLSGDKVNLKDNKEL